MTHRCLFDLLPVKLLHTLFTYFLAHEILYSFSDVSDFVTTSLLSYFAYRLDFNLIRRADFDFLCHRIRPEQVISLTLSDDNDTPGQTELFLSRFRIEQFTHLRSLKLIKIELESLEAILFSLDKLKQLHALSFNDHTIQRKYPLWSHNYSNTDDRMKSFLLDTYSLILPQLNQLHLNNSNNLTNIPLSNLRYLKLERCFIGDLKAIFQNAPQLKSLDICLYLEDPNIEINLTSSQLIRLKLVIQGYLVSMDQMEQFLSNLPYLKYLELIAHCPNDFIDGQRWEMLTKCLKTFNFKFYLPFVKSDDLDSFRTSYWLEEKCWLVAGDKSCLFSIPHFAPDHIDINKWSDKWSNEWSIKSINTLYIKGVPRDQFPPYTHIKKLYINCSLSRKHILSIVELKQLEYLSILSINDLLIFVPFESTIPNLYELKVGNTVAFHMIEQLKSYQLKQIRKLLISISDKNTDLILQELFYVFPHIEHLTDLSDICTMEAMIRLIDGFVYLLNASFYSKYLLHEMKSGLYPDSNSIIQNSHRLTANNFTYRVRQLSDDIPLFVTHWWIAAQPSQSPLPIHWPSGHKYILYHIKYLIFQSADTGFDRIILHFSVCCIVSQLFVPICASLPHIIESIIGYSSIPLYIYYILFFGVIYSLILLTFAYITFTSSSTARVCILVIIFQYCTLNQCCRFFINCDFHSAIGTTFINIYDMRYILYLGFKWLFN